MINNGVSSISDKYLLRGILTFVAIGFLLPGVFGVQPPRWFDDPPPLAVKDTKTSAQPTEEDAKKDTETKFGTDTGQTTVSTPKGLPNAGGAPSPTAADDTESLIITRAFIERIPDEHGQMAIAQQKESFINIVLPLILAANEEILTRRDSIMRAAERGDRSTLKKWAALYKLKVENQSNERLKTDILLRADVIPVGLALAQSIVESGWGTSRFARQGNALFGQWAWRKDAGLKPLEASNDRAVVRSFPNLLQSVRAYMHNLNTHQRYQEFRRHRAALSGGGDMGKANKLAEYLDGYAEIGTAYVVKLHTIMRVNKLDQYASAQLR